MKKHVVEIHVPKKEAVDSAGMLVDLLLKRGVKPVVVVDVMVHNRMYPYITFDGKIVCTRRLFTLCRNGGCD